jgi:DNA/RNA endonuclease YhcR with UshA esterase domain
MKSVMAAAGFLFVLFTVASMHGQNPLGPMMMRDYDIKTEVTITGTVTKIARIRGMHTTGLHLFVTTENQTVEVHLGPADFVESTLKFQEGDTVQVLGSSTKMMSRWVMFAREVKKGDKVLKLRNEDGVPLWSAPVLFEETPEDWLRG